MSYTFGAGTGDDATINVATQVGADNSSSLLCGWWYPTTLTATRGYWSFGNTYGAEIDTTTSEIRMRTDNTTDGQWLTSGAGITTNKWWFIAWLNASENTTVAGAWRVWVGDAENRPTEVTVTNPTTRSGNYTGSAAMYLGNKGTGTLAFQGDIGWAASIRASAIGTSNPFQIATSGAISNSEAEFTLRRWVEPIYLGAPLHTMFPTNNNSTFGITVMDLTVQDGKYAQWSHTTTPVDGAINFSGPTWNQHQPPSRPSVYWVNQQDRPRR